jgi:hypothetical protein
MRTLFTLIALLHGLAAVQESFAAGGGPPQQAELEKYKKEIEDKAAKLSAETKALQDRVSGKALESALNDINKAAADNVKEGVKGSREYLKGNKEKAAESAIKMADKLFTAKGNAEAAAADIGDAELSKKLDKARNDKAQAEKELKAVDAAIKAVQEGQKATAVEVNRTIQGAKDTAQATNASTSGAVSKVQEKRAAEKRAAEQKQKEEQERMRREPKEFDARPTREHIERMKEEGGPYRAPAIGANKTSQPTARGSSVA